MPIPKVEVVPLPQSQVVFRVRGEERLRWHYGSQYPRPFFYPLRGPSGQTLTRMGHPGAPNHDHHRSIWFAHHKVLGINFWTDGGESRIVQQQWLLYEDGDAGAMAVRLAWHDGHDPPPLLTQEVVCLVREPVPGETFLELQTRFTPRAAELEFGQTNYGFLAVRVARSLSAHFGGGKMANREGLEGERAIFGRRSGWMDYSGPVRQSEGGSAVVTEGITIYDHPANPRYPTPWHVRADGWMGAAVTLEEPLLITRQKPLTLRYLLHAHAGDVDVERARQIEAEFANQPRFDIVPATVPHQQFQLLPASH